LETASKPFCLPGLIFILMPPNGRIYECGRSRPF
jgi:hypothetical protein